MWVRGRAAEPEAYGGSQAERAGVTWLRDSTATIVRAIQESWPGIPTPEDVRRDEDGELLGRVVPTSGGWQAVTVFGAPLGGASSQAQAMETVRALGLSCLAEPWWVRPLDEPEWQQARLMEVRPDRVRLRWTDRWPTSRPPVSGSTWTTWI